MQGIFNYKLKGNKKELDEIYSQLNLAIEGKNNNIFSDHEAQCLLFDCKGLKKEKDMYTLTLGLENSGNVNNVEFNFDEMAEYLAYTYPDVELEGFGGFLDFGPSTDYYSPAGSSELEVIERKECIEIYLEDDENSACFTCDLCECENEIDIECTDEDTYFKLDYECSLCGKEYIVEIYSEEDE